MPKLTVFCAGTRYFMDQYSKGLETDCDLYGYDFVSRVVPDGTYSAINRSIQHEILEVVKKTSNRLCLMDPECRIIKPLPSEWIQSAQPTVFYKAPLRLYRYGATLPCPITMQPMFVNASDYHWFEWWNKCSLAASNHDGKHYVPHEMFLELALKFNEIQFNTEHQIYDRDYDGKHKVVKGTWKTDDTVILHPDLHGFLDAGVEPGLDDNQTNPILKKQQLHNHFQSNEDIKKIEELMFKEIKNLEQWPRGTVRNEQWFMIDDWSFNPYTGQIKHNDYPMIKYHHSIIQKIKFGIKTPVVKLFESTH